MLKRYGLDRFGLPGGRRTAPQSRQGLEPFVHGRRDQFVRGRPLEDRDDAMDIVVDRTSRPRLAWRIGVLVAHDHLLANQAQAFRAEVHRWRRPEHLAEKADHHPQASELRGAEVPTPPFPVGGEDLGHGDLGDVRGPVVDVDGQPPAARLPLRQDPVIELPALLGSVAAQPVVLAIVGHAVGQRDDRLVVAFALPVRGWSPFPLLHLVHSLSRCAV